MAEPTPTHSPALSVVIPCYCSGESLPSLVAQLDSHLADLSIEGYTGYEVVLVDDASPDNGATWQKIEAIANQWSAVRGIQLAQNVGQQAAVLCGLHAATGYMHATMDDDGQHDPAYLLTMLEKLKKENLDIVIASLKSKNHGFIRSVGSLAVRHLAKAMMGLNTAIRYSSFRVFKGWVGKQALAIKVRKPVVGYLLLKNTHNVANYKTPHQPRKEGTSNYTFWTLAQYFMVMVLEYSPLERWLKLSIVSLAVVSLLGTVAVAFVAQKESVLSPWAMPMVVVAIGCVALSLAMWLTWRLSLLATRLTHAPKQWHTTAVANSTAVMTTQPATLPAETPV